MYTVGLDEIGGLILYSQLNVAKIGTINQGKTESDTSFSADETNEIIFGCLLGDGKLEMPPRGVNARFGFTQAERQKEYFISVCDSLSKICSGKYRESSYLDKRTGKTYKSLSFWSRSLPLLNEFYYKFYGDKVKRVPQDLSLLTPLALAHWFLQKGLSGRWQGLYICTYEFKYVDVKRLTEYLKETYSIQCSIHRVKGKYRIYILAKSIETLKNLVLPFMHKSMLYKLGV